MKVRREVGVHDHESYNAIDWNLLPKFFLQFSFFYHYHFEPVALAVSCAVSDDFQLAMTS